MKRAYSLLEVREVGDATRTITGIATTPKVDSYGDIVDPMGVQYRGPVNLFLYHQQSKPVGNVEFGKATKSGIPFTATLPDVREEGAVRDRVNEELARHESKNPLAPLDRDPVPARYRELVRRYYTELGAGK